VGERHALPGVTFWERVPGHSAMRSRADGRCKQVTAVGVNRLWARNRVCTLEICR
jgi:hypothetical protein